MKKFATGILAGLLALSAAFLVACGDGGTTSGGDDNTDATRYDVTAEKSDFYDVSGQTTSATAGSDAYVVIAPQFACVNIEKVFYNKKECAKSTTEENRYEFTMPAENVKITVEYSFTDNETDNFLTWNSANVSEFEIYADETEYLPQFDDGKLIADVTKTPESAPSGYFTQHTEDAFSLNQSVIPDDALSVIVTNKSTTSAAIAFTVHIDRSKIKEGTAQIVLRVENKHGYKDAALLVCTVTVTAAA